MQRTESTRAPLVFRSTIATAPDRVFRVFFGEAERWLCRQSFIETWEQGTYRFCWPDFCVSGTFVQFDAPRTARFTWHMEGDALPDTMVVVGFQQTSEEGATPRTVVEVEHYSFGAGEDWDALYLGAACAWTGYLKNLKAVIEANLDLREEGE
jgi:uncharacterized protein YndB with AHSA1/START domain